MSLALNPERKQNRGVEHRHDRNKPTTSNPWVCQVWIGDNVIKLCWVGKMVLTFFRFKPPFVELGEGLLSWGQGYKILSTHISHRRDFHFFWTLRPSILCWPVLVEFRKCYPLSTRDLVGLWSAILKTGGNRTRTFLQLRTSRVVHLAIVTEPRCPLDHGINRALDKTVFPRSSNPPTRRGQARKAWLWMKSVTRRWARELKRSKELDSAWSGGRK